MNTQTPRNAPFTLILGLGQSGLAMARWCAQQGQQVRVADTRDVPPQLAALRQEVPQAEFVTGAFGAALLHDEVGHVVAAAVYCSPGLSPAAVAEVREAARQSGVFFGGELDLFGQALARLREQEGYAPQVLAITGTNGKTTVTSLTGLLLERAGQRVAVAGNIGPSMLDTLAERLDAARSAAAEADQEDAAATADAPAAADEPAGPNIDAAAEVGAETPRVADATDLASIATAPAAAPESAFVRAMPQAWVLELSSFQLEYSTGFEPSAGVILNISQDHIDWHGSEAAYLAAKTKVYGRQGRIIANRDDALTMAQLPALLPVDAPAGKGRRKTTERAWTSFGLDVPVRLGDWGLEVVNGLAWLVRAHGEEPEGGMRRRSAEAEVFIQRLMPADAMRIRGRHNASNALAALALASSAGAQLAPMLHGLREYRGEPHRVQPIGIVGGVEYFDDSKGTNIGATEAALRGLGAERRLVVILGGDGKGQDFTQLADAVAQSTRAAVLIGRDAALIEAALQETGVPLQHAADLPEAVRQAAVLAQAGDAVLLSPACASLDMFRNYAHRAEVFVDAVRALALDAGQDLEVLA
ncbi:UDP-N-acetylmuramoyl-L-alanine--D-glutamate ligase [Corticibacter populi]|uniref:UDP-N-acetylmuramoylalanine--D-glutamate ligase n=1 Tax=Corticibacter populi TaxID=1550736 RepID=A0A3M6QNG1_9BURK|nr:UDP-N-acetylmuramoyl-L-alanine--D-glutamate ligase [Corticibacter populi]RMX04059.1 UDP-N-acetylmuramoyl-L-alanine--D-glutamate ligase [Corticibacter populi]RZS33060.1 UDP-N-acetylmuramoylalanine--D-glutamate ligase [Corticibacter populi]